MRFIRKNQYGVDETSLTLIEDGEVIKTLDGEIIPYDGIPKHDSREQILPDGTIKKVKKGDGGAIVNAVAVLSDTTNPNKNRGKNSPKQAPFHFKFKKGEEFLGLKFKKGKSGSPSQIFKYLQNLRDKELKKYDKIEYNEHDDVSLETQELNEIVKNQLPTDEEIFDGLLEIQEINKDISGEDFDEAVKAQSGMDEERRLAIAQTHPDIFRKYGNIIRGYTRDVIKDPKNIITKIPKVARSIPGPVKLGLAGMEVYDAIEDGIKDSIEKTGYYPPTMGSVGTPGQPRIKGYKYGGIPRNINGLYEEEGPVIVPSNQITMEGINTPVESYDPATGEYLTTMYPGENYYFPDVEEILEVPVDDIPKAQGGTSYYDGYIRRHGDELKRLEYLDMLRKQGSLNGDDITEWRNLHDKHKAFLKNFERAARVQQNRAERVQQNRVSSQQPTYTPSRQVQNIDPVPSTIVPSNETEKEMRMKNWIEQAKEKKTKGKKLSKFEKELLAADKDKRLTLWDQYERNAQQRAREIPIKRTMTTEVVHQPSSSPGNSVATRTSTSVVAPTTPPSQQPSRWSALRNLGKELVKGGILWGGLEEGARAQLREAERLQQGDIDVGVGWGSPGAVIYEKNVNFPSQQANIPSQQYTNTQSLEQFYDDAGFNDLRNAEAEYDRLKKLRQAETDYKNRNKKNNNTIPGPPQLTMQDQLDALIPPARTFDGMDIQPIERRTFDTPQGRAIAPIEARETTGENPLAAQLQNRIDNMRQEVDRVISREGENPVNNLRSLLGKIRTDRGLNQIREAINQLSSGVMPEYMSDTTNVRTLTPIEIDPTPYLDEVDSAVARGLQNVNTNTVQGQAIATNALMNALRNKRSILNQINSQNQNIRRQVQDQNNQILSAAEVRDDANRKDYFTRTQQADAAYNMNRMNLATQLDRIYNERANINNVFTLENMRNPNYQIDEFGNVYRVKTKDWNVNPTSAKFGKRKYIKRK